uniref:Uncharacterized protein n=1 Tax=Arundo donax TaxID=35708 RepID=A0A0A9DDZ9_ARUDO
MEIKVESKVVRKLSFPGHKFDTYRINYELATSICVYTVWIRELFKQKKKRG